MIKLVMFDWDGVIVDGLSINYKIYREITKRLGKRMPDSPRTLTRLTNGKWEELYHNLGIRTEGDMEEATKIYQELFECFKNEFRLFPGIRHVLSSLKRKGIKIGIISNCRRHLIEMLIKKFGLTTDIDILVSYEDTERVKPDPDQIHMCLGKLSVKPEDAVLVGDMVNDIIAGRRAGLYKVIAVTYGWHSREQLERVEPDAIVDRPEEILKNL